MFEIFYTHSYNSNNSNQYTFDPNKPLLQVPEQPKITKKCSLDSFPLLNGIYASISDKRFRNHQLKLSPELLT